MPAACRGGGHRHLRREPREEERFLHGGIAAADDRDRLAAEEVAVAGRAGRDPVADERALGRQAQEPRRGARRDDERRQRYSASLVFTVKGRVAGPPTCHLAAKDLGAEPLGLRAHLPHELGPHDAVAMPRPVLDERREHELPAGLEPLDHERLQVGARGVERGGEARGPRPDDDDVAWIHGPCSDVLVDEPLERVLVGQAHDLLDDLAHP
jgi:hypothetical protein